MDALVPGWVRLGMAVALGVPQLIAGMWAVVAPERWFESFPGFDPRVVAADPPYNAHLATDAGAGFLATAVALIVGAAWGQRSAVYVALLTYLAFALPHLAFHIANPAPGLSDTEDVVVVAIQAVGVVLVVLFAWGARPPRALEPE